MSFINAHAINMNIQISIMALNMSDVLSIMVGIFLLLLPTGCDNVYYSHPTKVECIVGSILSNIPMNTH